MQDTLPEGLIPNPAAPNEFDLAKLPVTMGIPYNEQEDGLLHIPPDQIATFALEMVDYMERRIREMNPNEDQHQPVCGGCVLAALENMTIIAVVKTGRLDGRLQDKLMQMAQDLAGRALQINPIRGMMKSLFE